ncbi:MFS transporter [Actinomadura sp. 9N407]|uniref:MFS transporter n=1 Tax=Actinomadura sp. 9N407 TaxID=3375154 RepID=UPI0037BB0F29
MSRLPWERDFRLLWTGSVVSQFGAIGAGTASPLLALSLNGSPVSAGWVTAASALPGLLFHLPAGWLADRTDRRMIMWVSQTVRFLAAGVFVLGFWLLDGPPWLLVLGVTVAGTCAAFYGIAESAAIRDIVYGIGQNPQEQHRELDTGQRTRNGGHPGTQGLTAGESARATGPEHAGRRRSAMAKHEARHHIAQFVGRPLGGLLFGAGHLLPYLVDALTAFFSLRMMAKMRTGEFDPLYRAGRRHSRSSRKRLCIRNRRNGDPGLGHSMLTVEPGARKAHGKVKDGLALLVRDRFLATVIVVCAIANFFFQMIVLLLVVSAEERGISSSLTGLFLAASGVGGLIGAAIAPRSLRRRRPRTILIWCVWTWLVLVGVVTVADHPMVGLIAWGGCSVMGAHVNVALEVHKGAEVPRDLQGQITGITRFVTGGAVPLGALSGGYIIAELSPGATALLATWVMGLLAVAVSIPVLRGVARRLQAGTRVPSLTFPSLSLTCRARFAAAAVFIVVAWQLPSSEWPDSRAGSAWHAYPARAKDVLGMPAAELPRAAQALPALPERLARHVHSALPGPFALPAPTGLSVPPALPVLPAATAARVSVLCLATPPGCARYGLMPVERRSTGVPAEGGGGQIRSPPGRVLAAPG